MRLSIDEMVENLSAAWDKITPQDLYNGINWYPHARNLAIDIGAGDARKGAGLLAAMSPNKAWATNVALATDAGEGYFHGHVGNAIAKAQAIYDGIDPADVLPMHKKTGHFYMNILFPLGLTHVTVDRHMIRVLKSSWNVGEPKITEREYDDCVVATQIVAARKGLVPPAFQAALWEWARREYKAN